MRGLNKSSDDIVRDGVLRIVCVYCVCVVYIVYIVYIVYCVLCIVCVYCVLDTTYTCHLHMPHYHALPHILIIICLYSVTAYTHTHKLSYSSGLRQNEALNQSVPRLFEIAGQEVLAIPGGPGIAAAAVLVQRTQKTQQILDERDKGGWEGVHRLATARVEAAAHAWQALVHKEGHHLADEKVG